MTHSIYRPRSAPPPTLPLFPYTTLFRSWELLFKRLPLKPHQETEALRIVDLIRDQLITNEVHDAERFGFLVRRSEEHTSELQSLRHLVCRLLLEKKHTNRHSESRVMRIH